MFAAGLDGKWTREQQGKNGTTTQTLTFKTSGMNVTGTLDNGRGMPVEISEGMLHESELTFKVTTMGRDGTPQVTTYTGKMDGDELKLTPMRGGGGGGGRAPMEQTWKRAN